MGTLITFDNLSQYNTLLKNWIQTSSNKIDSPATAGTSGQVLRTNGDGTTSWADVGLPTDAQTKTAVDEWLDDHPDATTTVADGSITKVKLDSVLSEKADTVDALSNSLKSTMSLTGLKWYSGYYLSSNNSFVQNEYFKMSNTIPCTPGDKCTYHGNSSQTNRWVIVFFNKSLAFTSGLNNLGTDYTDIEFTIPTNAEYMRVLAHTEHINETYIVYGANATQTPLLRVKQSALEAKANVASLADSVDSLTESFVQTESEVLTNTRGIATINSNLDTIDTEIDQIDDSIQTNTANINSLSARTEQAETNIQLNTNKINALSILSKVAYVDPAAASGGDGSTTAPYRTIGAAIAAGYRRIRAKSGIYEDEYVRVENGDFEIALWSNETAYTTSKPSRERIIIFKGDVVEPTVTGNTVIALYTPRTGRRFSKVFETKELPPIDSSFSYGTAYNTNVFLWKAGHSARRYEPVLPENYTGAVGTFTYQNGGITLSPYETDLEDGLKVCVSDDIGVSVYFGNIDTLYVSDVNVLGGYFGGLQLHSCQNARIHNCDFVCSGHGDGLEAFDSNVELQNCLATGCAQDGYGFQQYGESVLLNCNAVYCGDDGVSHHRGCTGYIDGGNFSHNESGGITPAFGAKINISNAAAIGNKYGLFFTSTAEFPSRDLRVVSCVSKDNTNRDIYNSGYNITFVNCIYGSQTATAGHTNTFYG